VIAMKSASAPRIQPDGFRRARREDIRTLLALTRGPEVGRVRALRRLLKTLAADIYIRRAGGTITGCVGVIYRRSLAHGGLVATIDTLACLTGEPASVVESIELLDFALARARRRGCVGVDFATADPNLEAELKNRGFTAPTRQWVANLRKGEEEEE
jgi:N-acetylglutamate synthase-like GNAT family acetyltransferase